MSARARLAAERDPVWARWQYTADEWRWFDESEWQRVQTRIRLVLLLDMLWIPLVGFFMRQMLGATGASSIMPIFFSVILAGSVVFTVFGIGRSYRQGRKMHQARQRATPEIQIGPLGITQPGGTIPLVGASLRLGSGGTDPFSPPMHTLRQVQVEHTSRVLLRFDGWGGRNWPRTVRVPVPRGHEVEAEQLAQRFQQEIVQ